MTLREAAALSGGGGARARVDAVVAAQNFVGALGRGVKRGLHCQRVVAEIHRAFFFSMIS